MPSRYKIALLRIVMAISKQTWQLLCGHLLFMLHFCMMRFSSQHHFIVLKNTFHLFLLKFFYNTVFILIDTTVDIVSPKQKLNNKKQMNGWTKGAISMRLCRKTHLNRTMRKREKYNDSIQQEINTICRMIRKRCELTN